MLGLPHSKAYSDIISIDTNQHMSQDKDRVCQTKRGTVSHPHGDPQTLASVQKKSFFVITPPVATPSLGPQHIAPCIQNLS